MHPPENLNLSRSMRANSISTLECILHVGLITYRRHTCSLISAIQLQLARFTEQVQSALPVAPGLSALASELYRISAKTPARIGCFPVSMRNDVMNNLTTRQMQQQQQQQQHCPCSKRERDESDRPDVPGWPSRITGTSGGA